MFSLFHFSSIFPGGQLTPFASMCRHPRKHPCLSEQLKRTHTHTLTSVCLALNLSVVCAYLFAAVMKVISVIMFGLGAEYDQYWMPNPEYNYPHFSYGMAIISAFSTIFSSMAHQVYHGIVLREYRQPAMLQRGPMRASYNI